jgi:hypothetical protein
MLVSALDTHEGLAPIAPVGVLIAEASREHSMHSLLALCEQPAVAHFIVKILSAQGRSGLSKTPYHLLSGHEVEFGRILVPVPS